MRVHSGRPTLPVYSTRSRAAPLRRCRRSALAVRAAFRRALLTYAACFAVVAIVAKAAVIAIGLPDWVIPASLGLMGLGLPIVLITAYVQRVARRAAHATPRLTPGAVTAPQSSMATLALRASPFLSWRRAALTVGATIGSFVLLVAVLMALRPFGLGPLGSLMANGKLNRRDKILVADFSSNSADSTLGAVVSEAVRADLGQSPVVSVVTTQAVAAALQAYEAADNNSRRHRVGARGGETRGNQGGCWRRHSFTRRRWIRRHHEIGERGLWPGTRIAERERRRLSRTSIPTIGKLTAQASRAHG